MLTGMLAPTSGYAKVAGYDVRSQMALVREKIGICLQHDCLFPLLTVREHIEFFGRLKGIYDSLPKKEADASVRTSIEDVALLDKRNTLSKDLSGGMKRKLSVAIAFCGNSKTVILDEPTSGMDPFSRRFVWNLIRQYRESRCIVLTTVSTSDLLSLIFHVDLFRSKNPHFPPLFRPLILLSALHGRSGGAGRSHCDHGGRLLALRWVFPVSEEEIWCRL